MRFFLAAALLTGALPAQAEPDFRTVPFPGGMIPAGADARYTAPDDVSGRILDYEGRDRRVYLYDGSSDGAPAAAVVLLLHGAGRDGRSMIDMWRATADTENLVLVAPDSVERGWAPEADPADFLVAALTAVSGEIPYDPEHVYMFGHASGGKFAQFYANRYNAPWRAVAAHAATLDPDLIARQGQTPILHILGTNDRRSPMPEAEASARALDAAGHDVTLLAIEGHTHWLYEIGPGIAAAAWRFFDAAS